MWNSFWLNIKNLFNVQYLSSMETIIQRKLGGFKDWEVVKFLYNSYNDQYVCFFICSSDINFSPFAQYGSYLTQRVPLDKGCEVTLKQFQKLVIIIQFVKSLSRPYIPFSLPNLFHTSPAFGWRVYSDLVLTFLGQKSNKQKNLCLKHIYSLSLILSGLYFT